MAKDQIARDWEEMLEDMLAKFRAANPGDKRSDEALLHSLMEHFVAKGKIKKEGGKFVLPKLVK